MLVTQIKSYELFNFESQSSSDVTTLYLDEMRLFIVSGSGTRIQLALILITCMYVSSVIFSVPPTLPTYEPMLYDIGPGSARLSWRPASLPSFMPSQSPITYTLFVQDLPYKTWRPLVKGIPHTSYYVTGLQPDKEYMFRVQAENQFGSSRPTDAVRLPRFKG